MRKMLTFFLTLLFFFSSQVEAQKTIGIFTFLAQGAKPWDPDSVKSGITGSEEAVIYMSQKLADLGYKVTVFGSAPEKSAYSLPESNPRFVPASFQPTEVLDIAIAWRMPSFGEMLKNHAKKIYFWPHDTWKDPLTESQISAFTDVLWLSNWQQKQWSSVNAGFSKFTKIFGNGINPEQFNPITERKNPYSCIYGSNYGRGLEHLLDIWPVVKKEFPKATLDIYYGWQHWGVLSPEKELKMRKQVKDLEALDVKEHGMVSHEELNRAFEKTSLWTYPCCEAETFCITAIRAQLAGAIPVIIQHTGLHETTRSGFICSNQADYLQTLRKAMQQAEKIALADRKKASEFVLNEYTWDQLAVQWKKLFDSSEILACEAPKKTVCLTMVVKNNREEIKACLDSVKDRIDSWIIVDNGSEDNTGHIIQECLRKIPGTLYERPEETSKVKLLNETLSLAKNKADYLLVINPDEELVIGEDLSFKNLDQDYYYSCLNPQRELLINNHLNWEWTGKFHEHLFCSEARNHASLPGVLSSKELKESSPPGSPNFTKALHSFYLAQSYFKGGDYQNALKYHQKVAGLKDSSFPVASSLYSIATLSELLKKDPETVIQAYSAAYQADPLKAESLFRLAAYYLKLQNHLMGYAMAKLAISIAKPSTQAQETEWIYDHGIPFALGNAAFNLGKYEEAKKAYELALSRPNLSTPMEQEITNNLIQTNQILEEKRI